MATRRARPGRLDAPSTPLREQHGSLASPESGDRSWSRAPETPAPTHRLTTTLLRIARPFAIGLSITGCQQADDLREWKPSDHHHNAVTQAQGAQVPEAPPSAAPARPGLDEVTLVAWRRNCTTCHGQLGRGDGPQSPMTKPRDLSDPAWQQSVTDEAIAAAIRNGKGRMPAFPLPEATVQNLVALIRLLGGQGQARPATSGPPPGASAPGSAPPAPGSSASPP